MAKSHTSEELVALLNEELAALLSESSAEHVCLAYSGGLDSSVLLHLLHRYCGEHPELSLRAIHVNHHIHNDADLWRAHCKESAEHLGVMFEAKDIHLPSSSNLEATARDYRYRALTEGLPQQSLLCTAHHRNDQAETLLLNMLRSTGTKGMVGIHRLRRVHQAWLGRPLLQVNREAIHAYAKEHAIVWQEDHSNQDTHHARNYIRHQIAPLLVERWPEWDASFARSAEHHAAIQPLIDGQAEHYLETCLVDGQHLSREALRAVPQGWRNLVLRCWIERQQLAAPSESNVNRLREALVEADAKNGAIVEWKGVEFHYYRGTIYLLDPQRVPMPSEPIEWRCGSNIDLPNGMHLKWQELLEQIPGLQDDTVQLCFRDPDSSDSNDSGDDYPCPGHKIKKVFQEHGIPPWERGRIPFVRTHDHLLIWKLRCFEQDTQDARVAP